MESIKRETLLFKIKIVCLGALIIFMVGAPFSSAVPVEEKKTQAESVRAEIESINSELQEAIYRYDQAYDELERIKKAIAENTAKLKRCEKDLQRASRILNQRAKGIYKYGEVNLLEVILGSKSIDDLVERFNLLRRICAHDAELVKQIETAKKEMELTQAKLEENKAQQSSLVMEIAEQKERIESQLEQKKELLAALKAEIAALEREQSREESSSPPIQSISRGNQRKPVGSVVDIAYAMIGVPYVYGGASPDVGFDCSGLVWYCYAQVGIYLNRTVDYPPNLSWDELQPGDIVYTKGGGHVGIYTGGGYYIHAPRPGSYVQEAPIYGFSGGYRP